MRNTYLPYQSTVEESMKLSNDSVMLKLAFDDEIEAREFKFIPGQFIGLSIYGFGEMPVGIASSPMQRGSLEIAVRAVGNVSNAAHRLEQGDKVGVRGPFGNGFTQEMVGGKDLLLISGGCGIPPIRSLLLDALKNPKKYGKVRFLYGSKSQSELLFRHEYEKWAKHVEVLLTTDTEDDPDPSLAAECATGVVTTLLEGLTLTDNTVAAMCGPPIMYRFVIKRLLEMGLGEKSILVSLERRMKCGIGKCQHCTSGSKYVCLDGPVFTYEQVRKDYGGL